MSKMDFARKVLPSGFQIVSEFSIKWLFENHREIFDEFTKRVDVTELIHIQNPSNPSWPCHSGEPCNCKKDD